MALTEHLPQNPLGLAVVLLAITTTYLTALVIYRIYLSPLARIPGPKLAGATGWYEFYYDCLQAGRYIFEIERMHRVYGLYSFAILMLKHPIDNHSLGPIVRISPQEVHINDPEYFAELQSNTSKLDKYAWFYNFVAAPDAGFGTASHDLHRPRRGAMAKYFSMSNVIRLEPLIKKCVTKLCSRIEEHRKGATKVDLSNAYRCLATDVITEYALPGSRLMLESPDFAASYNRVLKDFSHIATWHRHIPIILPLLLAVPRWITARMNQASLAVAENQDVSHFVLDQPAIFADLCTPFEVLQSVGNQSRFLKRPQQGDVSPNSTSRDLQLRSSAFRQIRLPSHSRSPNARGRWYRNDWEHP